MSQPPSPQNTRTAFHNTCFCHTDTHTHITIDIRSIYHSSYTTGRNSKVFNQQCTNINRLTAYNERRLVVIFSCQLLTWDNNSLTIVVMIQQTGSGSPSGERTWSRDVIQPLAAKLSPTCIAVCTSADGWNAHYVSNKLLPAYLPKRANTSRKLYMAFWDGLRVITINKKDTIKSIK